MIAERNQKNHRWTSAYPVINIVITELWTIIRLWQCSVKDFEHLLEDRTCFHGLQLWPFFNCTSDACPGMSTEKAPNCLQEILLDSDIKKKNKNKTNKPVSRPSLFWGHCPRSSEKPAQILCIPAAPRAAPRQALLSLDDFHRSSENLKLFLKATKPSKLTMALAVCKQAHCSLCVVECNIFGMQNLCLQGFFFFLISSLDVL